LCSFRDLFKTRTFTEFLVVKFVGKNDMPCQSISQKCRFKVDKLVRDRLKEIFEGLDIAISTRIMEEEEYLARIQDKLLEESHEVLRSKNQAELCEELGDLMEVMLAIAKVNGLTWSDVEESRLKKHQEKGGFDDKIYCEFVEMDPTNPKMAYYRTQAEHYPQIKTK
jgi:predicted house-cleaning noncanonical NTP pyrophosphatase (MazG superfamily)